MSDTDSVTENPETWPDWLRADLERAKAATAEVRRRRRNAEKRRGRTNREGKRR